ncbi:hypothetical protein Poly30_05330 [Planctomycetes bacterium Poly30]|uniref:Uncharacterized protein n=2 Tax=Saltatorellus ferox TaxID=2528018 RepID=A0A518ELT0_9BACT|nr:hypothetical protein Poly30_05330 [Planctomycetes bacterium Poly30]
MGSAKITSDFESYTLRRVGVLPFSEINKDPMAAHEVGAIETSFHSEFAAATPYDLVPLRAQDLAELLPPDPFREGWYAPATLRTLRERFRLDAILVGTITSRRVVVPQVLGVQLDLVSCETGQTIWSADLQLDASSEETREAIDSWAHGQLGEEHGAKMTLLSPKKFASFAAYQMARLL